MSTTQALVDQCIRILSSDAKTHHATVRHSSEDGVLWAVFVADNQSVVRMKKSSFLKLSTIQSSKAQSLIQMYNTCNHNTQFVCWFTLEDSESKPMASKVMLVDGTAPLPGGGPSNGNYNDGGAQDALDSLKNDMMSFQTKGKQGVPTPHAAGSSGRGPMADERDNLMHQVQSGGGRFGTPQRGVGNSGGGRVSPATTLRSLSHHHAGVPEAPPAGGANPNNNQYQQILRVSLQVADSVSKMGATIDELTSRMDMMQAQMDSRPVPEPATMDSILNRLTGLEERTVAMENRINSFDRIQESFFDQVNTIRKLQEGSLGSGGLHPTSSSARPPNGSAASSKGVPDGGYSEQALVSNGRYATAVRESESPRSHNLSEAVAREDGTQYQQSGQAGGSPARTPGSYASRSRSSAAGGGESLSAMLASMEQRLSRIKTPK